MKATLVVFFAVLAVAFGYMPCGCEYPKDFDETVCGSDGRSYANLCVLECAQKTIAGLSKVSDGSCDGSSEAVCFCNRTLMPVCASDGKTYVNPCEVECRAVDNPDLKVVALGKCE
ncbi:PREDICTED: serine protease inhibitor dipetalogastin-like [Nicrophorus vespilloides]|uniref:Serine protease inhibitor dipetalogastin-like n=1 Tax=Nicrophorus vespilloides TaxID=110193 RepID=A0ABM1MUM8_NICVS|nr:PREDICTED: serine protease inhibitor dipetalogastin-like [Nicrophorus vespilloides]